MLEMLCEILNSKLSMLADRRKVVCEELEKKAIPEENLNRIKQVMNIADELYDMCVRLTKIKLTVTPYLFACFFLLLLASHSEMLKAQLKVWKNYCRV